MINIIMVCFEQALKKDHNGSVLLEFERLYIKKTGAAPSKETYKILKSMYPHIVYI